MNYEEWLDAVPEEIKGDRLWTVTAYKLALFSADLGWRDVTKLSSHALYENITDYVLDNNELPIEQEENEESL